MVKTRDSIRFRVGAARSRTRPLVPKRNSDVMPKHTPVSSAPNSELELQLDALLNQVVLAQFQADGSPLSVSDLWIEMTGSTREAASKVHLRQLIGEQTKEEPESLLADLQNGKAGALHLQGESGLIVHACPVSEAGTVTRIVLLPEFLATLGHSDREHASLVAQSDAISRSLAVIEFNLGGIVQCANQNFLDATGYTLEEVVGNHHRMFCTPELASSAEYKEFWQRLNAGEFVEGEFPRIDAHGRELWLQATYTPIMDANGRPSGVVKFASDITERKQESARTNAQVAAISRSQAVIQFDLEGVVQSANENFLAATGYTSEEIVGRHHRMFCSAETAASTEYVRFWEELKRGEFKGGEFERRNKAGDVLWLQATYNPIFDSSGNPCGVIKIASDITAQKLQATDFQGKIDAISRSQAVIEFNLEGHVRTANENFLAATGYTLDEIVGQHHRMFCPPEVSSSAEYREFWQALGRGEFQGGEFERRNKAGDVLWLQATYNPVFDAQGNPSGVVKFASDITDQKVQAADFQGKMDAISRSQAVIEFDLEGHVRTANENFLAATGYSLDEIVGQHHRMFCPAEISNSSEYREFWQALSRGEFKGGEFERRNKTGDVLWLQATYNPILDAAGKPCKVVKFASDITSQVEEAAQRLQEEKERAHRLDTQVKEILGVVSAAGAGDLSRSVDIEAEGPVGELASGINAMVADLRAQVAANEARIAEERERAQWLNDQVQLILTVVSAAGSGDLSQQVHTDAEGPVGELASGVNKMLADLRGVVSEVVEGSEAFRTQSTEILEQARAMATRTERPGIHIRDDVGQCRRTDRIDLVHRQERSRGGYVGQAGAE